MTSRQEHGSPSGRRDAIPAPPPALEGDPPRDWEVFAWPELEAGRSAGEIVAEVDPRTLVPVPPGDVVATFEVRPGGVAFGWRADGGGWEALGRFGGLAAGFTHVAFRDAEGRERFQLRLSYERFSDLGAAATALKRGDHLFPEEPTILDELLLWQPPRITSCDDAVERTFWEDGEALLEIGPPEDGAFETFAEHLERQAARTVDVAKARARRQLARRVELHRTFTRCPDGCASPIALDGAIRVEVTHDKLDSVRRLPDGNVRVDWYARAVASSRVTFRCYG